MISKNLRKENLPRKPRKTFNFQRIESDKHAVGGVFGKTSLASLVSEKKSRSLAISQKRSGQLSAGSRGGMGKEASRHSHAAHLLYQQCTSDSTVALAGPAGGAGIGNWEGNRLRLSFRHGQHEGASARAKCTAFWAQLEEQPPHIRNMCANGYPKGKEQRQAAVAEAEAAFREFLGKDVDAQEPREPTECAWANEDAAKAAPEGAKEDKDMKASLESVCRGKVALEGVRQDIDKMHEELGKSEIGPWQRRLRALQALGLDKLAAASEWRESPIRAPAGWPRSATTCAVGEDGVGGDTAPTVPAAMPPSQADMEQLAEDVRQLPQPQIPPIPEALSPPQGIPQIYRQMPKLRLPPPEEPGPPPAPVFPCPTQWCGPQPCGECMPCDPRYRDTIGQYGALGLPVSPETILDRGERPSIVHHKRRKSKPLKLPDRDPCQPECTCCECRASAPPPTPNLPNIRSSTGGVSSEGDGTTRLPDSGGAGDMGERQEKRRESGGPEENRRSSRSTRKSIPKVGSTNEVTEEDASRMSSSRLAGSMGEVVGLDHSDDNLKEEDPFRSVLLDVLKPGHVRPPLPPPAQPKPSIEPVKETHEQPMTREVLKGIFATSGSPGKVTSHPSLCRTALPSELPPPPPQPKRPSEFVGPGADLSGMEGTPLLNMRPSKPERSHYVGVKDTKVPNILPPLRVPPRSSLHSAAPVPGPTGAPRRASISTAVPEINVLPKIDSMSPVDSTERTVMPIVLDHQAPLWALGIPPTQL